MIEYDLEILVEIISNRRRIIEQRREDLVVDMEESLDDYKKGEVRIGTVSDLLRDLDEDPSVSSTL